MGRFGVTEILILLGIALLFFGGGRIANIGKGLGEGIRNFKKGLKTGDEETDEAEDADPPKLARAKKDASDDEEIDEKPAVKSRSKS